MRASVYRTIVAGILLAVLSVSSYCPAADNTPASAWPNLKEVIVVFKTHFDIGYTDMACNVVQTYRTSMIDKALNTCDATRDLPADQQFAWTLSGWPLTQILWPGQTPERRDRVLKAMRDGRIVWHALPITTHTESIELEELVRGMRFSSDLSRSLGMPLPRDAKMTDVPSHCRALPTILANAGVEFMHIGVNRASTPPQTPPLFWWEGPDGSRVMTVLVSGYGTGLLPPKDWPYQTWLALIHTGDNHGPPTPGEVKKLVEQAGKDLPGVKLRMGRLSDFADAIRREKANLPVIRADMPDTWIHGIMSKPIESGLARRIRPRIGQLEMLNTQLACWGVNVPEVKDTVAKAYEQSLMYGEHTWGIDVKRYPRLYGKEWAQERAKGTYKTLEESWAEHGNYIRKAAELIEPALTEHIERLARSVNVAGPKVVVYNPLPWSRSNLVSVKLERRNSPVAVRDIETGRDVVSEYSDGQLSFIATDVPSCGYKTFAVTDRGAKADAITADANTGVLDNGLIRIKVDPARGGVVSIVDKRSGREWSANEKEAFGSYRYEQFDADDADRYVKQYAPGNYPWIPGDFGKPGLPPASQVPRRSALASGFTMQVTTGPVSARAVLSAPAGEVVPHAIDLTFTLYRDRPFVDVEWTVKDKKPTPWPEAGWLCLPFAVEQPTFRLGRLGAIVDPTRDIQPGCNTQVFCLNTGMTITGADGTGVGICPLDSPLVSLGQPSLWQYKRHFESPRSSVYVNLFNNQWSTNFDQWCGGSWSSRVRIWPVVGGDANTALVTPSIEARSPMLAATEMHKGGKLKPSASGLMLSRSGVLVTAFGSNPDGEGTLLRLWDQAGQGGACRVTLPAGAKYTRAQPCDLRGRPVGDPLQIKDGAIEAKLKPFGPASFILK